MALGNMRSLGVHSLAVESGLCHHEFVLPADHWSDAVLVREFSPRARCSGQEREESGASPHGYGQLRWSYAPCS
jgi:hypothetical protein